MATKKQKLENRIRALGRSSLSVNIPIKFIIGALRREADNWRCTFKTLQDSYRNDLKKLSPETRKRIEQSRRDHEKTIALFEEAIEALIRAYTANVALLEEHGLDERGIDSWDEEFDSFDMDGNDVKANSGDEA